MPSKQRMTKGTSDGLLRLKFCRGDSAFTWQCLLYFLDSSVIFLYLATLTKESPARCIREKCPVAAQLRWLTRCRVDTTSAPAPTPKDQRWQLSADKKLAGLMACKTGLAIKLNKKLLGLKWHFPFASRWPNRFHPQWYLPESCIGQPHKLGKP